MSWILWCTGESWAHIVWPIDHCIFAYPIWHKDSLSNIEYLCEEIRAIATAFVGLWLMFRCTGESWAYLRDRSSTAYLPIPFGNQNRLGNIKSLCRNMRHRLSYSWQSRSFCWHITEVLAHLWFTSQRVGSWDTARVLLTQMLIVLPGFSWPMIEDDSQLRSSILSRMSFLHMYEANLTSCESLWMLSFQRRHASRATNKPPKRMYLQ